MARTTLCVTMAALTGACVLAFTPVARASPEAALLREVQQFEATKEAACRRGDFKAFAAHYARDGLEVENTAHFWTVPELWDLNCKTAQHGATRRHYDAHARAIGNTIIVTDIGEESAEHDGAIVVERRFRFLTVYVRQHGHLLQLGGSETPMPLASANAVSVKVDPKLLDDYVGEYEFRPGMTVTVTRDGDRLFGRGTDDDGPSEYLAESEATFYFKGAPWRQTFVRDATGRVTHALFRNEGAEIRMPKIK